MYLLYKKGYLSENGLDIEGYSFYVILLDILFRDLNRELETVTQIQIHWSPIDGSYTGTQCAGL